MTQTTDQERAEFEAAYVNIRKAESVSLTERDVKDWILRLDESGIYADPNSRMAFALWQAASRAQVVPQLEPAEGDQLPPVGSRIFIRHGRDDDAHACIVTGYYVWGDLKGDKRLHRVFVRMVYEGTQTQNARMLCDCYKTEAEALAAAPQPPSEQQAASRAQVVPMTLEQAQQSMRSATSHKPGKIIAASGLCAPQPPAPAPAPVQMPEPVAVAFRFETEENGPTETIFYPSDRIGMGWTALYTEHQVSQKLAAKPTDKGE